MYNKDLVKGVLFAACVLLITQTVTAPAWGQGGYTDIYVLGRPGSTFSPHPPKDLEELKDLFDRFESDLRVVLEKGGWGAIRTICSGPCARRSRAMAP